MYAPLLFLHSWLRWAVLLLGLIAAWRAIDGARSGRAWLPGDERFVRLFIISLDMQLLIGLLLYFLSPLTKAVLSDFGGAMQDPIMRFWGIEHVFGMVVGVALAHVGRGRARRAGSDGSKHRRIAIFFILALVAILAAVPWPGRVYGRPLLRW